MLGGARGARGARVPAKRGCIQALPPAQRAHLPNPRAILQHGVPPCRTIGHGAWVRAKPRLASPGPVRTVHAKARGPTEEKEIPERSNHAGMVDGQAVRGARVLLVRGCRAHALARRVRTTGGGILPALDPCAHAPSRRNRPPRARVPDMCSAAALNSAHVRAGSARGTHVAATRSISARSLSSRARSLASTTCTESDRAIATCAAAALPLPASFSARASASYAYPR